MEIQSIRGYAMSSPIEPIQERAFHGGTRRLLKRDFVLVVVETPDGTRGVAPSGASSSTMREYFSDRSHDTFADVINDTIAEALNGERIETTEDIHDRLASTTLSASLQMQAASAIDVAFHDIEGKRHGVPISKLLADRHGTDVTTEIDLYASSGMYMQPEGYLEQADTLEELGFFGYKYRPGRSPEADCRTIELLEANTDINQMVDAHTWWKAGGDTYTIETIQSLVEHANSHDVYWVEEPVPPDAYDGYARLASIGISLAGGESEESPEGLVRLGKTGSVGFLQGDVRHHGGFTGCWEAVEFCQGQALEYVPHNFGTWLGLVANAHLVAAAPDCTLLEYPVFESDPVLKAETDPGMYPFELAFDVIAGTVTVDDGVLSVPDGPGLGVDVDLSIVEEYPYLEGPWTEFQYSDRGT